MSIPLVDLFAYALIFIRIGSIFFSLPIYGDQPTPLQTKVLVSLATTICLIPTISIPPNLVVPLTVAGIFVAVLKEVLIGLVIGYTARLAFDGLVMAASVVGYQMGFGTANLIVPDANAQMSSFTAMHRIIMILIFFSLNMHHTYLMSISETFRVIPLSLSHYSNDLAGFFIKATASIFTTALQLASPVLVALLFTMAALGLIARTVPQMNVFTMSFPLSFFIGLLIYIASFPLMPNWLEHYFEEKQINVLTAVHGLKP